MVGRARVTFPHQGNSPQCAAINAWLSEVNGGNGDGSNLFDEVSNL